MRVHLLMRGGDVTQIEAIYTITINRHANQFTIYIFLQHCYYKGNDRSIMKTFSDLAKRISMIVT